MELFGRDLLANRYRNKGTAFTAAERDRLHLHGLLPPAIEDLDTQLTRVQLEYAEKSDDLDRHIYLRLLQQRSTVLFYRFLTEHLAELLPIVYTPTVGHACQQWSRIYRREHGLYLSVGDRGRIGELIDNAIAGVDHVRIVVVTDGERILGLGDLGVGGMGISIGKLALYSAVGGVDPETTLPIALDVGTDNEALLSDPLYLGRRHRRVRDRDYDEFVDEFVDALKDRCPGVLLQWEDFALRNAGHLLARHRQRICSFNDDIQGTAAVTSAAIIAGMEIAGVSISELRVVVVGAGSAGIGIANQVVATLVMSGLPIEAARQHCWMVDRDGLLHDQQELPPFQQPFARASAEVADWAAGTDGRISLAEVVRNVHPHALVGVTGQPGLFTEEVIRAMGAGVVRPIVMPLSNPTLRAEAIPEDIIAWTGGRALIGTGSPFPPVVYGGASYDISQVNNVYVFPGLGLGVVACGATEITNDMITAASLAIAAQAHRADGAARAADGAARDARDAMEDDGAGAGDDDDDAEGGFLSEPSLVPPIGRSHTVALAVAFAVARQAVSEGVAPPRTDEALRRRIDAFCWYPRY